MADPTDGHGERIARVEAGLLGEGHVRRQEWRRGSLAERMEHYKTPGLSVAVIDGGEVVWTRSYGVREAGKPDPVTTETLFQAGSISKPVAAMAALRAADQGRFDLDEDVNRYLRSWRVPANGDWQPRITVRQLLSHTAGTTVHGFPGYPAGVPVPSAAQVLDGAPPTNTAPIRVNVLPGTMHRYSGGGTTIVQLVLTDLFGMPFPEIARELVFEPLGMAQSTYEQPLPERFWDRAATAHPWRGEPLTGRWHTYPEMAAAGLWTTAGDLARFAIGVQRAKRGEPGAILSPGMAEQMLSRREGVEPHAGLGVFLEAKDGWLRFEHSGWDEGFVAKMVAFCGDADGRGAVAMVNSNQGFPLLDEVLRAVAVEYGWPDLPKERGAVALAPSSWEKALGEYELRPGFTVALVAGDDGLFLQAPDQAPIPLVAESETVFYATALDAELEFVPPPSDGAGGEARAVLRQGGREFPLKRRE
jgi:CubicO group peptidase (beta-lactamase class C family)